ncbi:helix-turn-helix domain-containing protein [Corynebacterium kalidii]|jgi:transcriptional regulator with XRE-family HTH domain|uniref:Helix-turn-helix domain-containing protein n=1 Tax=Corynebacterium kalidii TaxID=2931982 RepID=A0A9X1WH28_9CORY|nr:helix-turn-helix transcriptional regulator [Corynebacterium kalidii]MCJ7858333.1 helix-turn-helix domain-containing protein [Corynebacterium kalidii]
MQPPLPDLDWKTYGSALAHRIRLLRVDADMTQEELGQRAGMSRNQVQNFERGHGTGRNGRVLNPTMEKIYQLAYALDVPPAVLLPDVGRKVRPRSRSAENPPTLEEIQNLDIVWPHTVVRGGDADDVRS